MSRLFLGGRPVSSSLEGPSWEAVWKYLHVPENLQTCATAQEFNDATKCGPYCERFFFSL